jgi:hypothetical protein
MNLEPLRTLAGVVNPKSATCIIFAAVRSVSLGAMRPRKWARAYIFYPITKQQIDGPVIVA